MAVKETKSGGAPRHAQRKHPQNHPLRQGKAALPPAGPGGAGGAGRSSGRAPRPGLETTPEEIDGLAQEVMALADEQGVPGLDDAAEAELAQEVDPEAGTVGELAAGVLAGMKGVVERTQVDPARLEDRVDRMSEIDDNRHEAEAVQTDIGYSRQVLAKVIRQLVGPIVSTVDRLKGAGDPALKQRLEGDFADAQAKIDAEKERVQKQKQSTHEKTAATAEELAKEQAHNRMVETMIALRDGEEVDFQARKAAAETYAGLAKPLEEATPSTPAADRRGGRRA